jgi:radical SAM protein with 4Fe4S-binding SPASM domain
MVKWFQDNKIWVQRSIDGCPEAQEKYRPNSIARYEEATKVWKDFSHSRRMTIQPEFAKLLMKSLHYFEEQGFKAGISPMPNYYTTWTEEQIQDFVRSLYALGEYYIKCWNEGRPFYCYYFSRELVSRFLEPQKSFFGCGGGRGLHCASWDGWLYLCHRFSKEPRDGQFCFGSLKEILAGKAKGYGKDVCAMDALYEGGKRESWREECKTCSAQFGCEKGCMHTNWFTTKTLDKPPRLYCVLRQATARIVTFMDSKLRCKDPDWWTRGQTVRGIGSYLKRKQEPEYLLARLGEAQMRVDQLKQQLNPGRSCGN